ncbi:MULTISPECIES: hypothetical protein [Lactobacillus]|uniref:mucin-binding protein n=1 Tax=Lactobacillus TaxID=1578 RepID=UPI001F1E5654|nr:MULTISPECIES: hypothetical protein [Lactobacillus]
MKNGFRVNGKTPVYGEGDATYDISFKHRIKTVDAEHPEFGFTKEDMSKKVKQTVHFEGGSAASVADDVKEITFTRTFEVDEVTKKVVHASDWQPASQSFMLIAAPTLPGFVPDQTVVGGQAVTADSEDQTFTINYEVNRKPSIKKQTAKVMFVDVADQNAVVDQVELTGEPNAPVDYDPSKKIAELTKIGYVLVDNPFSKSDIKFFSNLDGYVPVFVITLKNTKVAVNSEHPLDGVPADKYEKTAAFVVNFKGTGQIVPEGEYDTPWTTDLDNYQAVKVPVVAGYHTNVSEVKPEAVRQVDQVENVTYQANGRIVPIDENGNLIPEAPQPQFKTDKNDPTKVVTEAIVPDLKGYTHDEMTVTPADPGADLRVVYKAKDDNNVWVVKTGRHNNAVPTEPQQTTPAAPAVTPAPEQVAAGQANQETAVSEYESNVGKHQIAFVNFIDLDNDGMQ